MKRNKGEDHIKDQLEKIDGEALPLAVELVLVSLRTQSQAVPEGLVPADTAVLSVHVTTIALKGSIDQPGGFTELHEHKGKATIQ